VAYFQDAEELYRYVGGVFRIAGEHPEVGPKLRGGNLVLRLNYAQPDATLTVVMKEPELQIIEGPCDIQPDVTMALSGDNANKYWRGEYNIAVGLAKGEVKAKGPVTKILKLVPITKPVFPMYRELVASKDGAS
jgi:putative sterol carrier protein